MEKTKIRINIPAAKKEVPLLRDEKIKLDELYNKMLKSKENLVSGNLSGKTNEVCIKNNELFLELITKRINELEILITKLEKASKAYEEQYNTTRVSMTKAGSNVNMEV